MSGLYERLRGASEAIARLTGRDRHDIVMVLGSGLGGYPDKFSGAVAVPYTEIPGFPIPGAVGHAGTAYSVECGDNRVLMLSGRVHAYEGYPADVITFAVRTAVLAGCRTVVLTNASGGCGGDIQPGDLVVITDHINLAGMSPLRGDNDERLGPRFPDMTDVYTPALRDKAHAAASEVGVNLREGVYLWWHGPMFETPGRDQDGYCARCVAGRYVDRSRSYGCPPHGYRRTGDLALHQPGGRPRRSEDHCRGGDRKRR